VKDAGSTKTDGLCDSATEARGLSRSLWRARCGDAEIAVWRLAKASLEGAREVETAQLRDVGKIMSKFRRPDARDVVVRRFCCHPARPPQGANSALAEPFIRMSSCKENDNESVSVVSDTGFSIWPLSLSAVCHRSRPGKQSGREFDLGKSQVESSKGPAGSM